MTLVPSARLLFLIAALGIASSGLLILPEAWPVLLAANLAVFLISAVDLAVTPRPGVLRAGRTAPDRMSVLHEQRVMLRVESTSRVGLWVRIRDDSSTAFDEEEVERAGPVSANGETR